jgi:hypothetical protein
MGFGVEYDQADDTYEISGKVKSAAEQQEEQQQMMLGQQDMYGEY